MVILVRGSLGDRVGGKSGKPDCGYKEAHIDVGGDSGGSGKWSVRHPSKGETSLSPQGSSRNVASESVKPDSSSPRPQGTEGSCRGPGGHEAVLGKLKAALLAAGEVVSNAEEVHTSGTDSGQRSDCRRAC